MSILVSTPLLDSSLCIYELRSRSRDAALGELAMHLASAGGARDAVMLREALQRRERFATTATGKGLAFPNARTLAVGEARIVLARSSRGVPWEATDGLPVHLVCAVISPGEWADETHHDALGRVVTALRLQRQRQKLLEACDAPAFVSQWRELLS